MDQPQHQVFGTDKQSYRYMDYPFQKQPLQLLYPGRVMQRDWHYTGENIPNEDPIGLAKTQYQTAALAYAAKMEQEALARHLGGRDKIVRHPAVEPEAVIEDPSLASMSIQTTPGMDGNLDNVPSRLDDLSQVEDQIHKITADVRKSLKGGSPAPLSKEEILPRYNWQAAGVGYDGIKENIIETFAQEGRRTASTPESSTSDSIMWISIVIIGILAAIFIAMIIYEISKHRSYAKTAHSRESYDIVIPRGMTFPLDRR